MNTDRTVIIENVGESSIGLGDTQGRMYRLAKGARMRISAVTLQDILDLPGSRVIFKEGYVQVSNITAEELYSMGLNEDEIRKYLKEEPKPTVVITKNLEEEPTETIIIEEPKEEIVEKVKPVVKSKTTTKKAPAKKTTKKSSK